VTARAVLADGAGWQNGRLLALYSHRLFESAGVIRALFGAEAGARLVGRRRDGMTRRDKSRTHLVSRPPSAVTILGH
jgi:hypothetical protein